MAHLETVFERLGPPGSNVNVLANVVFVHGLGGDARETWQADKNNPDTFWPDWLHEDLKSARGAAPVGVWSIGYPAEIFEILFFTKDRKDSVPERARNLLDAISAYGLLDRPIVFVTHSLGGILVKQMLRSAVDSGQLPGARFRRLALVTRLVIFLSTPHTGASIARLAEVLPALSDMVLSGLISTIDWLPLAWPLKAVSKLVLRRGKFTKALEAGDPHLYDLHQWYRNNVKELGIETKPFYENQLERGLVLVVDRDSANPGIPSVDAVSLDASHSSICKPRAPNLHYERIKAPIVEALRECPIFRGTQLAVLDIGRDFKSLTELPPSDRLWAAKKILQPIERLLGRTEPVDYETSEAVGQSFAPQPWQLDLAQGSDFDMDRLISYVWTEYQGGLPKPPSLAIQHETERLAPVEHEAEVSLIPLYYAARCLRSRVAKGEVTLTAGDREIIQGGFNRVKGFAERFENVDRPESKKEQFGKTRTILMELLKFAS